MTLRYTTPSLLLGLLLAACAQPPAVPAPPTPPAATGPCEAEPARFAVGQTLTPELREGARRSSGAARTRVLRLGQVVTLEFDGARLNLQIDEDQRVTTVRCG
jgi:hypothetical protein